MALCIWVREDQSHLPYIASFEEWLAGISEHEVFYDRSHKGSLVHTIFTMNEDDATSFKLKWM